MTAARYSLTKLRVRLADPGIYLSMGAFVTHVQSAIPSVAEGIHHLYPDAQILEEQRFADFHVALERPTSHRRWLRPQVIFRFDGYTPFKPLPVNQAFTLFEWGLNWCITTHAHQYLIIHAAVIEKEGFAAILPAPPGSGKSTLTAGLVNRGWRLLSDELGLISKAGLIQPVARPVSLKNQSIEVIRRFAPEACIGRVVKDALCRGAHVRDRAWFRPVLASGMQSFAKAGVPTCSPDYTGRWSKPGYSMRCLKPRAPTSNQRKSSRANRPARSHGRSGKFARHW